MDPIKRRARIYIFLIIVFSFLLGYPAHTLALEVTSVSSIASPYEGFTDILKIVFLILAHLLLISLLFIRDEKRYKQYLMWFPLVFVVAYLLNAIIFIFLQPTILLFFLPYFTAYGLAIFEYTKYRKTLLA